MKRNLSNKAIKAMVIGMAVTLSTSTAISGVVKDTIVTVKAETNKMDDTKAPASIVNGNFDTELANENYVITSSGLLFKVTDKGTVGTGIDDFTSGKIGSATLVKKGSVPTEIGNGQESTPYAASLENGVLVVKADNATESTGKVYKLNVKQIGDGINPVAKDLSNVNLSNLLSVNLININNKAFSGTTISEDLNIDTDVITSLILGDEVLKGATVNGNLTIGGSNSIVPNTGNKVFKNLTVNGNLDLSNTKINNVLKLSSLGLGALDNEVELGNKGVTVTGELILPTNTTVDDSSLKHINIGKLDLSKVMTGTDLPQGLLQNSVVGELILPTSITNIVENTFAGATLTNFDFSNITNVKWYSFIGATINGDLDFSGDNVGKHSFTDATINGNLNLSGAKLEGSDMSVLSNATITGDLDLSNTTIPATTNDVGVLSGVKVNGNVKLTGVTEIPANTFKNSTLTNIELQDVTTIGDNAFQGAILSTNIELPNVTTIKANAFDIANTEKVTIYLPNYDKANIDTIDENAFGTTATIDLVLPFGISNEDVKALKNKIANQNVTVTVEQVEVNGYVFESTKDKEVALVGYSNTTKTARENSQNNFIAGKLTYNDVEYTLTKVGNGTDSLTNITDSALNGHTSQVTEVAASAFENNKNITVANFPNVTTIGNKAFAGTGVKTADLGSQAAGAITVASDAFNGVSTLNEVKTNNESKSVVKTAVSNSPSSNITLTAGNSTEVVKPSSSSGGGSSSSSGSGFTGSGANIGNTDATTENTTSSNTNNNNNTSEVVENKDLTLDVINLPSVTGEAKVFGDVSTSHWAKSYIDKLSTAGVINGSNGMFNPNGQTKRADATIMLVNLLGLQPEANSRFADVASTAYYAPYVGTASTYGIVNGSNGMFNPENTISRQDTMVMMAQILKALDLNVNTDISVLNQFSDVNSVSSYATESVAILVNSGIISGNNGRLNPTSPVTRAEMATIMSKLYDVLESATK